MLHKSLQMHIVPAIKNIARHILLILRARQSGELFTTKDVKETAVVTPSSHNGSFCPMKDSTFSREHRFKHLSVFNLLTMFFTPCTTFPETILDFRNYFRVVQCCNQSPLDWLIMM